MDGACHDVTGGKRVQRVHLVHELFALVVLENSAKTAHCFGDEEWFFEAWCVQTSRMELHELDVLEGGSGACCNRHAVTTAVGRANCILPNAACAAGRENGCLGVDAFDFASLLVDDFCADAALGLAFAFANQVLDVAILEIVDVLLLVELAKEGAHDFLAGEVRCVQNAVVAVSAFEVRSNCDLSSGDGVNWTPHLTSCLMVAGPLLVKMLTGSFLQRPAPASSVSAMWNSNLSVFSVTVAIPPWA